MRRRIGLVCGLVLLAFVVVGTAHAAASPMGHAATSPASSGPSPQAPNGSGAIMALLAILLLAANVGCVAFAVQLNFRKSLSYDFADSWEHPRYLRALPNLLAILRAHRFVTAWPRRCSPWSMHRFERRLRRAIRPCFRHRSDVIVEHHMALWIWVESHRSACRQFLRARRLERALECLSSIETPQRRARLLAFLNTQGRFPPQTTPDDETQNRLRRLQRIQIIMREHGYNVAAELEESDLLDQVPAEDLPDLLHARRHVR